AIDLEYRLRIPVITPEDYTGYFGFGSRQINLAHWLVMTVVRDGDNWLVNDHAVVGVQTAGEPADWDVTLTVDGASDALQVAAHGEVEQVEAVTWHTVHEGGRHVGLSMSVRSSGS